MQDAEPAVAAIAKKTKRSNFAWNKDRNLTFVKICHQKLVYTTKGDLTKDQKWQSVLKALKEREEFEELEVSAKSLAEKFRNNSNSVLETYGMTKDSVNLSGLPEKPPEYEDLLFNMVTLSRAENDKAKRKRATQIQKKKLLNGIESIGLANQGWASTPTTIDGSPITTKSVATAPT